MGDLAWTVFMCMFVHEARGWALSHVQTGSCLMWHSSILSRLGQRMIRNAILIALPLLQSGATKMWTQNRHLWYLFVKWEGKSRRRKWFFYCSSPGLSSRLCERQLSSLHFLLFLFTSLDDQREKRHSHPSLQKSLHLYRQQVGWQSYHCKPTNTSE